MAFGIVVRRSYAAIAPLASRTTQRQSLLSVWSKSNTFPQLQPRLLLPVLNYSSSTTGRSSADESLSCALESAINSATKKNGGIFPFTIEEGYHKIWLTRTYRDETIKVSAYPWSFEDNPLKKFFKFPVELDVTISKKGKVVLSFKCTATGSFWDKIKIQSLKILNRESGYADEQRDFSEFDYNTRYWLKKYLEARGIKSSIMNHMYAYRNNKIRNDEVILLDDLKKIVDQ